MNVALIVIDMQKCFLAEYQDTGAIKSCCEYINYVGRLLRKAGHTIIHVQDVEDAGRLSAEALDFTDQIEIAPTDLRVQKQTSNAFWQTSLEKLIKENGIDLLVMCGQAAEHCVVFTYNGARERGFAAAILQNGVLSQKPSRVDALMEDRPIISYAVIEALTSSANRTP